MVLLILIKPHPIEKVKWICYSYSIMRKKSALLASKIKKLQKEEEEKVMMMGDESEEKGIKATKEIMDDFNKKQKQKEIDELNRLDMNRRRIFTYTDLLQHTLHELILNIRMPKEYEWGVWFDGKGIILAIRDKNKVLHKRAFRPCHDAIHDRNAIKTLALWAEDIYDKCEGKLQPGIWTPQNRN